MTDHVDETVFGPLAHPDTPHRHSHLLGQAEPLPGTWHDHPHYHPGGGEPGFPAHGHPHRHDAPEAP